MEPRTTEDDALDRFLDEEDFWADCPREVMEAIEKEEEEKEEEEEEE